eukprot:12922411-Prorocentrum_lima.AAC.1
MDLDTAEGQVSSGQDVSSAAAEPDPPTPISTEECVKSPSWQQWVENPDARLQVLEDFSDEDIITELTRLPA